MFSRCFIKQHPTSILPPLHPHRHHKSRLLPSPGFIKAATCSKDCFLGTKSFWSLEALFSVVRLNRYLTQLLRSCNELEEILRRPVSKPLLPLPWPGMCVWGCDLPGALMMVGSWSCEVPDMGGSWWCAKPNPPRHQTGAPQEDSATTTLSFVTSGDYWECSSRDLYGCPGLSLGAH